MAVDSYWTPLGAIASHAPTPALAPYYTTQPGSSIAAAKTSSALGWILTAAVVAMLYQIKQARPLITGILLLIVLGLLLHYTPTIQYQFKTLWK